VHSVLRTNGTTALLNIAKAVGKALLDKSTNYINKHKTRDSNTEPQSVCHTLRSMSCGFKHWTWASSKAERLRVDWVCLKRGYWGEHVDTTGRQKRKTAEHYTLKSLLFCIYDKIQDDQIKEEGTGGTVRCIGKTRNAYKVLEAEYKWRDQFPTGCRWADSSLLKLL